MRIPNSYLLKENLIADNHKDIKEVPEEIYQPLDFTDYMDDLKDEKSYRKLIRKIESLVRTSFEYQEFREFLTMEMDMTQCAYLKGIDMKDSRRIKVEIHHTPFTLYDIVEVIVNKHRLLRGRILILDIAEEVLRVHYEGKVGLIPLSVTVHEAVHNGVVFVPLDYVYGKFQSFYDDYQEYMKTELKNTLKDNIEMSKEFWKVPDILRPKYYYMKDGYSLPKTDIFHEKFE